MHWKRTRGDSCFLAVFGQDSVHDDVAAAFDRLFDSPFIPSET